MAEAKYYGDTVELAKEIKKLNPKVNIYMWNNNVPQEGIFVNISAEQLKLPKGFYYNEKNGITNKHNTDGAYNILNCKPIKNLDLQDDFIKASVDEVVLPKNQKTQKIVERFKNKINEISTQRKGRAL